jgi:hypothetical protein
MEEYFTQKDKQRDGCNGKNRYGIEHIHNHLMRTCMSTHQYDHKYKINEHKGEGNRQTDGEQEQEGSKKDDYEDPPFHLVYLEPVIQFL